MALLTTRVPGVYTRPRPRAPLAPRVRTDVVGFVGVAGSNHLHEAVRLEDWREYEDTYLRAGSAVGDPPAGSRLADAVRAFFANGGSTCWVVNVAEAVDDYPGFDLGDVLLGEAPSSGLQTSGATGPVRWWGLDLLVRQPEVAIVVIPDLFAEQVAAAPRTYTRLTRREEAEFAPCAERRGSVIVSEAPTDAEARSPLFPDDVLRALQIRALDACDRVKHRVFLLLCPPAATTPAGATAWRASLGSWDGAALYWPWVVAQDVPGADTRLDPPLGYVAGVYARRDIERGPHVAPANEGVRAIVGVERRVDDRVHELVYDEGVNPLRHAPGRGVQVQGARTLAWSAASLDDPFDPIGWVNVRRGLTAVERYAEIIGHSVAFEPNTPMVWMRLTQSISGYLKRLYEAGGLYGTSEEQAYFVRCDASLNPPESIDQGLLVCEVGVAIAAPAEFVVFRLGRREGVIEIEED